MARRCLEQPSALLSRGKCKYLPIFFKTQISLQVLKSATLFGYTVHYTLYSIHIVIQYCSRVQEAATCTVQYCTAKVQEILNFLANNNNINYRLVFRPEIVIKNLAMYVNT